ncbi:AMP-binding protein [Salinactinospora qingdaonensis]|uniref:Non-ribosomal peptide synthetase n=1 Tax=Salinactinospora qingdaonensis TaxID=702744 RepID=A0ABP7EVX8_9ACTN
MSEAIDCCAAFVAHAQRRPQAPALVYNGQEISYGDLYDMARRQQARLEQLPADPAEPVGIAGKKSPAAVALILGCLLARRPFLLPSATLGEQLLGELFSQAGCRHVLVPDAAEQSPAASWEIETGATLPLPEGAGEISFMLTTSGSTSLPKVVPLGRDAVNNFIGWAGAAFNIQPGTTVLNYAPLNFDLCLLDIWTTLAHGGRVVLVDPDRAADGRHLFDLLATYHVHVAQAVPMFYGLLLEAAQRFEQSFEGVEHVMFTGDAVPEHTLAELPHLFPKARFHNIYGCTETNDSFIHEIDPTGALATPLPIGTPLPGVDAVIVGSDGTVLEGEGDGELYVSTPFQSVGYLDPARRAAAFVSHPQGDNNRSYFRTGDLVHRDANGRVHLVGRSDFQVKVRGVAVNTAEVERVLLEHPSVLEAAVLAQPDSVYGRRLVSAVRRAPDSGLNSLTLRGHCARHLPQAAIPAQLRIVDDPLPKTPTGKVDRNFAV